MLSCGHGDVPNCLGPGANAFSHGEGRKSIGILAGHRSLNLYFALASLEEDFITWREQFWPAVCEHFGVEATGEESRWVWVQVLVGARLATSDCSCAASPELLFPLQTREGTCEVLYLVISSLTYSSFPLPPPASGSTSWWCTRM